MNEKQLEAIKFCCKYFSDYSDDKVKSIKFEHVTNNVYHIILETQNTCNEFDLDFTFEDWRLDR